MAGLSFENWLECLRVLLPPKGLIHIGAGGHGGVVDYLSWDVQKALLIEANPRYTKKLQQLAIGRADWKVHTAAIDQADGQTQFNELNLAAESGLLSAESLTALWPNLRTIHTYPIATCSLDSFLASNPGRETAYNWLVISCLGASRILEGAAKALSMLDVLVIRATLGGGIFVANSGKNEIDLRLEKLGYRYLATATGGHPLVGYSLYQRIPPEKKTYDNFAQELEELKQRHLLLTGELEQLRYLLAYLNSE